jgi:hypothetical protein
MADRKLLNLTEAAEALGEDRNVITILIAAEKIPVQVYGIAKCLDSRGMKRLRQAVENYRQHTPRRKYRRKAAVPA